MKPLNEALGVPNHFGERAPIVVHDNVLFVFAHDGRIASHFRFVRP